MSHSPLLAISPIDGRYAKQTQILSPFCSEAALNKYRLQVEIKWLALLKPDAPTEALLAEYDLQAAERIKAIETEIHHDVKAVEYYLSEQVPQYAPWIHFACTSEDINNLAYALMLKDCREQCLLPHYEYIHDCLLRFAHDYASLPMLARTHGQAASPTTVGKEFANIAMRIKHQLTLFRDVPIVGKFNGATGNFNAHHLAYPDQDWPMIAQNFVEGLGLHYNSHTTQIEPHDMLAAYMHAIMRLNTILIDFCQDCWGYISLGYFSQRSEKNHVGSSTMPHKINPIDFENAEGNLGMANALMHFFASKLPISRFQRDLSDSTVLRNIGVAMAHTLIALQSLQKGLNKLAINTSKIEEDLAQHPEILGEAIQTIMRRYHIPNAYEQLKTFTRGNIIDTDMLHAFIYSLELPEDIKTKLAMLKPRDYIGLAERLSSNTA